jgi:transcription antitermination factor NusG
MEVSRELPPTTATWFALSVKTRWEKRVQELLSCRAYETFLPLYNRRSLWSDRVATLELPLFPNYLFCRFNLDQRVPVLTTPGVLQIVGSGSRPVPVDDRQLDMIRIVVFSKANCEPHPYLEKGQRVRIIRGALEGIEGFLIEHRSQCRVLVAVDVLARSVSVQVSRDMVMAIGQSQDTALRKSARA